MAKTKKTAKKSVPKVEQPKQIVLTQEQYDELVSIQYSINKYSINLRTISTDEDTNLRTVCFELGKLQVELDKSFDDLDLLLRSIEPDSSDDWFGDNDDDIDPTYN